MKILYIISITFLIVFAVGCDEMQSQVMKPMTMPDGEGPTDDEVVTSVGTMKDPSMTTDDSKEEDPPAETQTTEEDTVDEPQTPDAAFVSADPEDGDIKVTDSIELTFDNDPGEVTVNEGTVSGSGTSRTISGPFPEGLLSLTISWPNGDGSKTLEYNVEADESQQIPDAAFSSASPASGDISENGSIAINFDNDPGEVTVNTGTVSGSGTSRTISGPFPVGSLSLTISWPNGDGSKTLAYNVEADESQQIPDATFSSASPASGDISESGSITINFDNDPGEVTVSEGTVSGSGTSRTISGPFSVGSLALSISWTNGNGSHTLNYNVEADEPQIPDATFSSASPASGDISESGSITINFDNDPGEVTVSEGTVSGSGTSRTISGPFSVGSLALSISWTNGNGSHTLNYNVEAGEPQIPDATFSSASPASGDISESGSITINFDNDPGEVTVNTGTVSGSGTTRTISGPFSEGSLTLSISWTNGNGSHTLNYNVEADEPQIPDATFSSASPASGDISESGSITINFDNDPGEVTVNTGTVSGSGTSRTISGPFSVGSLTLTISWTNGNGSKTLEYTVEDSTPPEVSTSSTADGAVDVDPTTVSNSGITVTFNETIGSGELKLYKDNVDVGWSAMLSGNTITITKGSGQELSHDTMYEIKGTVKDSADNEKAVSITFTTKSASVQLQPLARGEGLRIGVTAPTFSVNDSDGNTYSFDGNNGGSSNIVILFYRGWW